MAKKVRVHGREYDFPEFNLGDMADMEKITGQGYDLNQGGVLGLLAAIYVAVKRENPGVTVDEIRALGPDDFEVFDDEAVDASPPQSQPVSEPGQSENSDSSSPSSNVVSAGSLDGTREVTGTPV